MNDVLKLFFSLSLSGSLLALALFALKPLYKDRFSKKWQYYIWIIIVLRFLIPYSPEWSVTGVLFKQIESEAITQQVADIPDQVFDFLTGRPTDPALQADDNITPQKIVPNYWNDVKNNIWLLWIGVAVMLFVRKVTSYHSFLRYVKAGARKATNTTILEIYKDVCATAKVNNPLPIYTNNLVASPMLVGVFRPIIILPDLEADNVELRNMFQHEFTHYKRFDIFYKWVVQTTVCLHWFNPLVYIISKEINNNCELSCDEAVINSLDKKGRMDYGDTLIAYLKSDGNYSDVIVSITLNENSKLLKERLEAILKFNKKSKIAIVLSIMLTTIILCGAIITGAYAVSVNTPEVTIGQESATLLTEAQKINTIKLFAEDCSVTVRHSVNNQFLYDYNQSTHKVISTINGSVIEINVERIANSQLQSLTDMVVIYLPDKLYNSVTVEGQKAGVSLPELNANLYLSNDGGTMSAYVPESFDKTIDFKNANGSGALVINSNAKNYALKVSSQGSSVDMPSDFPVFTPNRTWKHQNGNGNAKINLDLQGCSFSIALEDTRTPSNAPEPSTTSPSSATETASTDATFVHITSDYALAEKIYSNHTEVYFTDKDTVVTIAGYFQNLKESSIEIPSKPEIGSYLFTVSIINDEGTTTYRFSAPQKDGTLYCKDLSTSEWSSMTGWIQVSEAGVYDYIKNLFESNAVSMPD